MTVQEYSISALTDIPPLVYSFATQAGWAVAGTTSAPLLRNPLDVSAVQMRLTTSTSGQDKRLLWDGNASSSVTSSAAIKAPTRLVSSVETALTPTKLTIISTLSPAPSIALVVEFGANLYRHLYFGHIERIGGVAGGEVISGTFARPSGSGTADVAYDDALYQHLFSAQSNNDVSLCGGVRAVHTDNPTPWRQFRTGGVAWNAVSLSDSMALGGYHDAINTGYLWRGVSSAAGMAVMVPLNLYVTRPSGNLSPIGRPSGVRMINIRDIEPGSSFSLGSETWRVYPAFRKSEYLTTTRVGTVLSDETSYRIGYAYRTA